MAVSDSAASETIRSALVRGGFEAAGLEAIESAWSVVAHAPTEVEHTLGALRGRMRSGAALIAVTAPGNTGVALEAGANACLRLPLVAAELLSALRVAADTRSSHERIAALTRELDDQSVLVSLGRVSAGLSHELAAPLAVIRMNLECLELELEVLEQLQGAPDLLQEWVAKAREGRSAVAESRAAVERATALLTLMREVVGTKAPTLLVTSLAEVVETAISSCARAHLVEVELERAVDERVLAWAHPRLTEQILVNLISNGVAAARTRGTPHLRVHVYQRGPSAVVSVRDNGPGIVRELQETIFEPFFTTRRAAGGTGLGLALCREYARQMGARITVWSELGRGACFRLHLRAAS